MAGIKYSVGYITDCGNVRMQNQDSVLIKKGSLVRDEFLLAAVADGMGGLEKGELASSEMISSLNEWWTGTLAGLLQNYVGMQAVSDSLSYAIEEGNRRVQELARQNEIRTGTTLSLLFLYRNQYVLKHIGDSRVYRICKNRADQLTRDHTWCQREMDRGLMTEGEAKNHSMRHVLVNAIGSSQVLEIDSLFGQIRNKELLLVCSDGFYNCFSYADLVRLSEIKGDSQDKLNRAFTMVKNTEAEDNFSAVLIQRKGSAIF